MFCSKCGSQIPGAAKFCPNCGKPSIQTPIPQSMPAYQNYNAGYSPAPQPKPKRKSNIVLFSVLAVVAIAAVVLVGIFISGLIKGISGQTIESGQTDGNGQTNTSSTTHIAADGFRENYTRVLGNGEDTWTVMVYVCGSNLESEGGCATSDIEEMIAADYGSNVNVILQTGGCTYWKMDGIEDGGVQRWQIVDGQLVKLQDLGQIAMLTSEALKDFVGFATDNFPANRNALVFWDHGGGSLYGFGSDELFPDTCLYLTSIASALSDIGKTFDIVGFDACLMGSIETAYMLEPYADYLVASEETEPSYGWDYTPWLTALGQNTSIDSVELGQSIIDSFINQNGADSTLSIVSLREIPFVYQQLSTYMANADAEIANAQYDTISAAVAGTKSFAEGNYDMIDLVDFTNQSEIAGEDELVAAVSSAVKYRNDCTNSGVYGLSLYFPYTDLSVYETSKEMFASFGFGGDVYDFYDTFVSIMAGGQTRSNGRTLNENLTGDITAPTDFSTYGWYDAGTADSYAYDMIDYSNLETYWDEANQYYYLPLTPADWELITAVEMQIMWDDGEGYIDLGSDQYYEEDANGNLILNYGADNTWVAIGGQVVCYYAEETIVNGDVTTYTGYVPAVLNGSTDIEIILQWDNADGYILGYRLSDSNSAIGDEGTIGKGYLQFNQGDVIDYVCDYYTYDGTYDAQYYFGEPMTIGDTLPAVTYEDVGANPVLECYMIVDIYQNYSWTETIEFK